MKCLKIVGAVGMLVGLCLSSEAAILLPGGSGLDAPQAPGPAPLATQVTSFSFGNIAGTVTSWVVRDPANPLGGLSFYYQLNNTGTESLGRFSAADFGLVPGSQVEVSTIVAAFDGALPGGVAPTIATRSDGAGSVVGFDFVTTEVDGGQHSEILVVNTAYQSFTRNTGSVIDNNSVNVSILAPSVPETSTVLAGGLLLIPFALSTLRILRKSQA